MQLVAVGLHHRSAPVELREALDFRRDGLEAAHAALARCRLVLEAVLVSTCNRSEIYAVVEGDAVADACARFMAEYHRVPWAALAPHLFVLRGREAARHLFRVAAGLESLVVGEPQILGQVKDAFGAMAAKLTDTAPSPRPVSLRTRLPTVKALENRRLVSGPLRLLRSAAPASAASRR